MANFTTNSAHLVPFSSEDDLAHLPVGAGIHIRAGQHVYASDGAGTVGAGYLVTKNQLAGGAAARSLGVAQEEGNNSAAGAVDGGVYIKVHTNRWVRYEQGDAGQDDVGNVVGLSDDSVIQVAATPAVGRLKFIDPNGLGAWVDISDKA